MSHEKVVRAPITMPEKRFILYAARCDDRINVIAVLATLLFFETGAG
jgi:hypothetical protein